MTDMTLQTPLPETAPAACRYWGPWASIGWGLLAVLAWMLTQFIVAGIALFYFGTATPAAVKSIGEHALFVTLVAIVSAPTPIAVLAFAVRRARCGFAEYLALVRPRGLDVAIGLLCIVVILPLGDVASHLTGRDVVPPFVIEAYKHARDSGALIPLAIAMVIAAPAMEEFLFRGFLLPGLATARFGMPGAIALTSLAWASMHIQYEMFFIAQIFLFGLVLGWLRWRSGSTTLTLGLHALVNLSALTQTAIIVEWLS